MALLRFLKQPNETLDYNFDFSLWMPTGDSIASSTVTADAGITLGTKTNTGNTVQQFISGSTEGTYKVTCRITTTQGRIKEAEILIQVMDL